MANRTKADILAENEELRAALEHAQDVIGEALGYEDDEDEADDEDEDDD